MSGVRQAVIFAVSERAVVSLTAIVQAAVLSRILTPAEIGLAMIGIAAAQIMDSLRDFGTTTYLIQHRHLSATSARTAFTVVFLICALVAAALAVSAGPFAAYYDQPGLISFVRVLAAGFLAIPFSAPLLALMRREFRFRAVACVNVIAALVYTTTVISLALAGFGYMSLAWASVAGPVAAAVASIILARDVSAFRPCLVEWRIALSFGGYSTATNLMNRAYDLLPVFLIGLWHPLAAVGLYSRALVVSQVPERVLLASLSSVVLPSFAADVRESRPLNASYLQALSLISVVQWPALVLLAILARPAVAVLLGPQWQEAVPLVQAMALASTATFAAMLSYPVLVAAGHLRDTLTSSLVSLSLSSILVAVACYFGPLALALSLFATMPLQALVVMAYIRRRIGFTWKDAFSAVKASILVCIASAIAPATVVLTAGPSFDVGLPLALVAAAGAFAGWLLAIAGLNHPIYWQIRQTLQMLKGGLTGRQALASRI